MRTYALVVALPVLLLGCAQRDAQIAVQASLTGLAHGLRAADEVVAETITNEEPEVFLARREQWHAVVTGLEHASGLLHVGQAALTVWVVSGRLPAEDWGPFCESIEGAVAAVLVLLDTVGVPVPQRLHDAVPMTATICVVAARWAR